MNKLNVQLVTPTRSLLNSEFDSLSCPTTQGQITILRGHAPLVSTLAAGELITRKGSEIHNFHISGGFIEVQRGNTVIILADEGEHHYEIDIEQAEAARVRAQSLIKEGNLSEKEFAATSASLHKNLSRLRIARKHAHRRTAPITSEGVLKE